MESWRKVWREGITPKLSTIGLKALHKALLEDDIKLIQGATTIPSPSNLFVSRSPIQAACGISFCGWQGGEGISTVDQAHFFFADVCQETDLRLGNPAACRFFLNWFDETPREEVRRQLLAEVSRTLAQRSSQETRLTEVTHE